jgi:uncharacterized protein (TIGR02611 family)
MENNKLYSWFKTLMQVLPHPVRWLIVTSVGFLTLLAGIAMLVLPGPGILTMLVGIAILAIEFKWAQESLKAGEQGLERIVHKIKDFFKKSKD